MPSYPSRWFHRQPPKHGHAEDELGSLNCRPGTAYRVPQHRCVWILDIVNGSQMLQAPTDLDEETFLPEVKKLRGKKKPLTVAGVKALRLDPPGARCVSCHDFLILLRAARRETIG